MRLTLIAAGLVLAACGAPSDGVANTDAEPPQELTLAPEPEPQQVAAPEIAMLEAGRYCYLMESETSTEGLELDVSPSGVYSGRHYGTVHDEAAAYYTAFETTLSHGEAMPGMEVNFQTYTEVDGDTQSGAETWVIMADSAHRAAFPEAALGEAACDHVSNTVWPPIEE